jgi:hypothetical protein
MKKSDLFLSSVDAYKKYNQHNHVYNRLDLLKEQDIECDPIGLIPSKFPIVIKPIINLIGVSCNEKSVHMSTIDEYLSYLNEYVYGANGCINGRGNFWYSEIKGNQYISNILLKHGKVVFNDTFLMYKNEDNIPSFYKHVYGFILNEYLSETLSIILANYTGPVCINFIDDTIIDCRLSWWKENYIFKKHIDFVSCIPILLEHNKPMNMLKDDIIYVPFRKNIEDAKISKDYICELKKCTVEYTIFFMNTTNIVDNATDNSLSHICTFVVNSDKLNDVLAIRGKCGLL